MMTKKRAKGKIVYNGVEYDSVSEMCRAYGVKRNLVYERVIKRGYSHQDALDAIRGVVRNPDGTEQANENLSIDGACYDNMSSMCRHLGISRNMILTRTAKGMSIQEAVDDVRAGWITVQGKVYKSMRQAASAYGFSSQAIRIRANRMGITFAEALEYSIDHPFQKRPVISYHRTKFVHDGKPYHSLKQCCTELGLPYHKVITLKVNENLTASQAVQRYIDNPPSISSSNRVGRPPKKKEA